ncbi:hypothetical protein SKAU_G00112290 [Synaphobranchus kaupii]|uniref:Uncharacterized protein n=1 Tax=Synaphobranchus kaupii TaxID=118154 RepID=A0A9Q1G0R3_SYNKA|nr:hypothetical protein SKAU_G00112290 [Synaphobranchus kaupii]
MREALLCLLYKHPLRPPVPISGVHAEEVPRYPVKASVLAQVAGGGRTGQEVSGGLWLSLLDVSRADTLDTRWTDNS